MYESFYGLRAKPFAVVPDPRFLYWAGPHRLAFAMLEYGIRSHAGFTVITGEVGAGKTTLIRLLLSRLPENVSVGLLSNTDSSRGELLQWVLMAFDQEFADEPYVALFSKFRKFLMQQYDEGRRTVLIIDEAQNLGSKTLEELRLLSNVNTHERELLQIVLSGQPELKHLLAAPEMTQFAQRVSSDFHLTLLKASEVRGYVEHRLKIAGADHQIFEDSAYELIHRTTRGTPRLINTVCDTAMLYGFAVGSPLVTREIVQKVLEDKKRYGVFPMNDDESTGSPA